MSDAPDLLQARAVLHEFDLGPLKPLDVDDVIRRGHRRRRAAFVQAAAAALVVVLAVTGGIAAVQSRVGNTPSPATGTTDSPTSAPSPSDSPTTETVPAAVIMASVADSQSVHVVTRIGGATLDVVVTKAGAHGTLTYQGKTSEYLGVDGAKGPNGALYVEPDALSGNYLSADQVTKAQGRWVLMTGVSPLNHFMNILALSQSFYPSHGTSLRLGPTKTINGVQTIALQSDVEGAPALYVEIVSPYHPVRTETVAHVVGTTYSDWDAPAPELPSAPAASDVYKPFG